MPNVADIGLERVTPTVAAVLSAQGIPAVSQDGRTRRLAEAALAAFRNQAQPKAIYEEVSHDDFIRIYGGEGHNAVPSVLDQILPSAVRLAVFAVTMGPNLGVGIEALFRGNDFAAGAMLDAASSLGADLAAEAIEQDCRRRWIGDGVIDMTGAVLRFSPGYCGWNITGQKRLFARLRPEVIDIHLNESCLMQPLKSVSGVVVAAPAEVFDVDNTFPFCAECTTHSCRDRFARIRKEHMA